LAAKARRMIRGQQQVPDGARDWRELVDPDLSRRTSLVDRYRQAGVRPNEVVTDETLSHRWNLANGLVSHGLEVLDRAAAHAGVEPRYPFWDRALVEFCLSLPAEEKLSHGWSRHVLRRAMEGVLPAQVQWRRDKVDFKSSLAIGMVKHHRGMIDATLGRNADRIAGYINVQNVRAAFERLEAAPASVGMEDLQHVWRSVVLSTWLCQFEEGRLAA
jgi:asparagine synthase (glutamine-hydrolysing)